MVSASTLIWYHAHWQTYIGHTGTNRLTHIYKYILTPPPLCTQQLPVLHWMNNLLIQMVQKVTLKRSIINQNKNAVNEQNTHTIQRETELTLERVSVSYWNPLLTNTSHFVLNPLPLIWENFQNSNPPPSVKEGVRPTMFNQKQL